MRNLIIAFCCILTSWSYGQLDSVSCTATFVTNPSNTSGLDSVAVLEPVFQVRVYLNDIDYLGKIIIKVYDAATNTPMAIKKFQKSEIVNTNYVEGNFIIFNVPFIPRGMNYNVEIETTNFQNAYLPNVYYSYISSN